VAEHVEFRPEFKRDGVSPAISPGFPTDADASEDMADEAFGDSSMSESALEEVEELAEVTF
jgi:hypothetical protein